MSNKKFEVGKWYDISKLKENRKRGHVGYTEFPDVVKCVKNYVDNAPPGEDLLAIVREGSDFARYITSNFSLHDGRVFEVPAPGSVAEARPHIVHCKTPPVEHTPIPERTTVPKPAPVSEQNVSDLYTCPWCHSTSRLGGDGYCPHCEANKVF